jgi:hypothetical protein
MLANLKALVIAGKQNIIKMKKKPIFRWAFSETGGANGTRTRDLPRDRRAL